jgi:hypothetical protein
VSVSLDLKVKLAHEQLAQTTATGMEFVNQTNSLPKVMLGNSRKKLTQNFLRPCVMELTFLVVTITVLKLALGIWLSLKITSTRTW